MSFYTKYIEICNEKGIAPTSAALQIGISKPTVTAWKNGGKCSDATLAKVAQYFNIPVSYFDENEKPSAESRELTDTQRKAIDLIQSIEDDAVLEIFIAAMEKAIKK